MPKQSLKAVPTGNRSVYEKWWTFVRSVSTAGCALRWDEDGDNNCRYIWCDDLQDALVTCTGLLMAGEMTQRNFDHFNKRYFGHGPIVTND